MAKSSKAAETTALEQGAQQASGQTAKAVEFVDAEVGAVKPSTGQFDLILDMEVPISVVLGQVELPIHQLLKLGPGAVIPLSKGVDAGVDLYLQNTKFAEADVVVVDDQLAVRIKTIVSQQASE